MTNPVSAAELSKRTADKLRAVVTAKIFRIATFRADHLKTANNPYRRQACINLDRQCLTVEIVKHIKRSKLPATVQTVTHKINTPNFVETARLGHRFTLCYRYAMLLMVFKLKFVLLIHPVTLLVIPFEFLSADRIEYLRKPAPGTSVYHSLDLLLNFLIVITLWLIVKSPSADTHRVTGRCNA